MNTAKQIQQLPEEVSRVGLRFKLYKRGVKTLMYSEVDESGNPLSYEVFRIKTQDAREVFGRSYPAGEAYPSSQDFGITAVWYHSLEDAVKWFEAWEEAPEGTGYMDIKRQMMSTPTEGEKMNGQVSMNAEKPMI